MLLLDQQLGNQSHLLLALDQNQEGQSRLLPVKAVGALLGQMTAVNLITEQGQVGSQQEALEVKDREGIDLVALGPPVGLVRRFFLNPVLTANLQVVNQEAVNQEVVDLEDQTRGLREKRKVEEGEDRKTSSLWTHLPILQKMLQCPKERLLLNAPHHQ